MVYPWEDDPERTPDGEEEEAPVECGASIFVRRAGLNALSARADPEIG